MGDYRSLRVWKLAHALTLHVYGLTRGFPDDERFGLTSQIRRSAASIPANLAEGCGRDSDGEIARFARVSLGSANELDYHALLAHELGYFSGTDYEQLRSEIEVVKRMLARLALELSRLKANRRPTTDDRRPPTDDCRPPTDD